jgi:DMSO/TMAO reductase YedYZ molybdopterin-dependent catalytic subunit
LCFSGFVYRNFLKEAWVKNKILGMMVCLALVISALTVVMVAAPAATTAATTSITVVKYAADGTTVMFEDTIDYATMESTFPVQGDGVTHYWTQGPTFDPNDLLDPDEQLNLKDKGALKGTDVKDLCDWAGGASPGDTIKITSSDGYSEAFQYDNIYNPEPAQGKLVACWWRNGQYVPAFDSGIRCVFLAQTTNGNGTYVFGDWDMHEYLPEANWHYWYQDQINYYSSDGLAIKYISEIEIYTSEEPLWTIQLVGAGNYTMAQTHFEQGAACHTATWVDGNDTWSGMPLWMVVGWVDDDITHGLGAFNDTLAAGNYTVRVIASDAYSKDFSSSVVARNDNMIVANKLNGVQLPPERYPLRLVGPGLSSGQKVSKIAKIELIGLTPTPTPTPTPIPTVTPTPGPVWNLQLVGAGNYTMAQSEFEQGVACHSNGNATWATWVDGNDTWSGMPLWMLCGWVDDGVQHGSGAFNDALAASNYIVRVIASDAYSKDFSSSVVARNDNMVVANKLNGAPLPENRYPLRLVGPGLSSGQKVSKIVEIELIGLPTPVLGITRQINGAILPEVSITIDGIGPMLSDQSGQYEIMATTTGTHTIVAHKDGFRDSTRTINITGLGPGYAVTCNFQGRYGLIPNAPNMEYALDCIDLWLFPPNQDTGLDIWTALDVINAWLYPRQ